jgi:hypothetical protein
VLPRHACGLALALLLFVVVLQRLEAASGEGDAALGSPCLGGQRGESASTGALKGATNGCRARAEVEVFPVEAEEFSFAESGAEGEFDQRVQPVALGCGEEPAGFVGGEGFEAAGPWGAGADVARDLLLTGGVLEVRAWARAYVGVTAGRPCGQGR